jgi:predicted nucleotidyltransferase
VTLGVYQREGVFVDRSAELAAMGCPPRLPRSSGGGNVIAGMSPATAHIDLPTLRARRDQILSCAAQHGARNVRVFGSIARGEAEADSDVDLLVKMDQGRSLLDLVGLWQELEDLLGARVDVLSEGGVSPHLRERIFADAVAL